MTRNNMPSTACHKRFFLVKSAGKQVAIKKLSVPLTAYLSALDPFYARSFFDPNSIFFGVALSAMMLRGCYPIINTQTLGRCHEKFFCSLLLTQQFSVFVPISFVLLQFSSNFDGERKSLA